MIIHLQSTKPFQANIKDGPQPLEPAWQRKPGRNDKRSDELWHLTIVGNAASSTINIEPMGQPEPAANIAGSSPEQAVVQECFGTSQPRQGSAKKQQ